MSLVWAGRDGSGVEESHSPRRAASLGPSEGPTRHSLANHQRKRPGSGFHLIDCDQHGRFLRRVLPLLCHRPATLLLFCASWTQHPTNYFLLPVSCLTGGRLQPPPCISLFWQHRLRILASTGDVLDRPPSCAQYHVHTGIPPRAHHTGRRLFLRILLAWVSTQRQGLTTTLAPSL